jgi:peroxiredoxin
MSSSEKKGFLLFFTVLIVLASSFRLIAQRDVTLTIHLRGVAESKISLLALSAQRQYKPINEVQGIQNGKTTTLRISKDFLPGELVLRFDYREKKESTPYPSEKRILISNQDLELWVSPVYCNNPDSTWFQKDERENTAFASFSMENSRLKEKIGLLQQFLMNYDEPKSKFYQQGIEEYERRRRNYNEWLDLRVKTDKALFVSSMYRFQFIPRISWEGSEKDRIIDMCNHYFDGIDFSDPVIIKTSQLNDWMNSYVNLYGQMATSLALRDSLFPAAAKNAVEKAKQGSPVVYGWMVDYFYNGFESNNIPAGMKVLEPYLDDPNCLTSKRREIERRLEGIKTLVAGSKAPNIELKDKSGNLFNLYSFNPASPFILVVFWSADCNHCMETVNTIYPWLQQPENKQKVSVVAISLDETETEMKAWEQKSALLDGWRHIRASEGVRSKAASDYFILATPVMVLVDTKTKTILVMPNTLNELMQVVNF